MLCLNVILLILRRFSEKSFCGFLSGFLSSNIFICSINKSKEITILCLRNQIRRSLFSILSLKKKFKTSHYRLLIKFLFKRCSTNNPYPHQSTLILAIKSARSKGSNSKSIFSLIVRLLLCASTPISQIANSAT